MLNAHRAARRIEALRDAELFDLAAEHGPPWLADALDRGTAAREHNSTLPDENNSPWPIASLLLTEGHETWRVVLYPMRNGTWRCGVERLTKNPAR